MSSAAAVQPTKTEREVAQLCSVRAGDGLFGIDTRVIREVLANAHPRSVPLAPECIAGVLAYRGEMLTVVGLRALLGLRPYPGKSRVLVLDDAEPFGVVVDEVGGIVSVPEGAMEGAPGTLDAAEAALLDGVVRTEAGLMARLSMRCLRPQEAARYATLRGEKAR